jgi:hypothetical protein
VIVKNCQDLKQRSCPIHIFDLNLKRHLINHSFTLMFFFYYFILTQKTNTIVAFSFHIFLFSTNFYFVFFSLSCVPSREMSQSKKKTIIKLDIGFIPCGEFYLNLFWVITLIRDVLMLNSQMRYRASG